MQPTLLAKTLREASKAYYETGEPIMSDEEYDRLVEELRAKDPGNAFFSEVGAPVQSGATQLPVAMPSLDKKKPDTVSTIVAPVVVMDKLDGISALWVFGYSVKSALYLRGNGLVGQDVSHCIPYLQGLKQPPIPKCCIRGELILPRSTEHKAPRNWVNGVLHRSDASPDDLKQVRFVAYQVCMPNTMPRGEQMAWLSAQGFECCWNRRLKGVDKAELEGMFMKRRAESAYECDGIVIGLDKVPEAPSQTAANPKDAFAFKMPVEDQKAETVLREVEWASSRSGNWIPRLRFDPVQIGAASIQYCTGFHAKFIEENFLGAGARIVIRRSGDVIPVLDKVLVPADVPSRPPEGRWKWDATETHAIDTTTEATPEVLALELAHSLVALGIEGVSKVTAKKLVDHGVKTFKDVFTAAVGDLQEAIGAGNGQKLFDALRSLKATEAQWIYAYTGWPKGFGTTRITATLAVEPNVEKWTGLAAPPKGQSSTAFAEVQKAVPGYIAWRKGFGGSVPVVAPVVPIGTAAKPTDGKKYCMSGFRDAAIQSALEAKGWVLEDRVTKSTVALLIPDDAKETTKVKAARTAGVKIIPRSQVQSLL